MSNKRRSAAVRCCTRCIHSYPGARHILLSMRILSTCKLEREQKHPPQFHTCSFSSICLLPFRPFCVRSEYAMRKKPFVRKRLLRRLFTWDCFLKGKRKRKKKRKKKTHVRGRFDDPTSFLVINWCPIRAKWIWFV